MKSIVIVLSLAISLLTFNLFSQSLSWDQLEPHNKRHVKIVFIASNGYIYGYETINRDLYFKKNESSDWIRLGDLRNWYAPYDVKEFDQQVYFNGYRNLYKHNVSNDSLEIFVSGSVVDFNQLDNGNIIVYHYRLQEYDTLGNLIKTGGRSPYIFNHGKVIKGDYWNYFQGYNYEKNYSFLMLFDDNVEFRGDSIDLKLEDLSPGIQYANSRLYGRGGFYDEWLLDYRNYYHRSVWLPIVLSTGELVQVKGDKLYFWDIWGANTTEILQIPNQYFPNSVGPNSLDEFYITEYDSSLVISWKRDFSWGDKGAFRYDRRTQQWSFFDNELELPFSRHITANNNTNLYVYDGFYDSYSHLADSTATWEVIPDTFPSGRQDRIIILKNGNVVRFHRFYPFISTDRGQNWIQLDTIMPYGITAGYSPLADKDFIYDAAGESLLYSEDGGFNWNEIDNSHLDIRKIYGVSPNEALIYQDSNRLSKVFNLTTGEEYTIEFQNQAIKGTVYLNYENGHMYTFGYINGEQYLFRSLNEGKSFTRIDWNLGLNPSKFLFDSNNNLVTFRSGTNSVYTSYDYGESWVDISPSHNIRILDMDISPDNHAYITTIYAGVFKSEKLPLGNNTRILQINAFQDENDNCAVDSVDLRNAHCMIKLDTILRTVDYNGMVEFYLQSTDTYNIEVITDPNLQVPCQSDYLVNLVSNSSVSLDVPLDVSNECAIIEPSLGTTLLRRCMGNRYHAQVCNNGTEEAQNISIELLLDQYFDSVLISIPFGSVGNNEYRLDSVSLEVNECVEFNFELTVSCDAALGASHCVQMNINLLDNSCDTVNSTIETLDCRNNIGSYDPNDKSIFVNGIQHGNINKHTDEIEYMIRFQNTGTDTAFNVRIEDPISDKFDLHSVRPFASSHPYKWQIQNRKLIFHFKDILLVDSFTNEPLSHGFVKFKIRLKEDVVIGDEIENTAFIYFDFNEPIQTNTVNSKFGVTTNNYEIPKQQIFIFPNPTNNHLWIKTPEPIAKANIKVYDISARLLIEKELEINKKPLDVSFLNEGLYFLRIIENQTENTVKFVIQH